MFVHMKFDSAILRFTVTRYLDGLREKSGFNFFIYKIKIGTGKQQSLKYFCHVRKDVHKCSRNFNSFAKNGNNN